MIAAYGERDAPHANASAVPLTDYIVRYNVHSILT
jgi:hypothetical protein